MIPTLAEPIILGIDFLHRRNCIITLDGQGITRNSKDAIVSRLNNLAGRDFLSADQNASLHSLLRSHEGKFSQVHGFCTVTEHRIRLTSQTPIKQRYMPRNPAIMAIINEEIDKLLAEGRINRTIV